MAIIDYFSSRNPVHQVPVGVMGVATCIIDFSLKNCASADVVEVMDLPAKCVVTKVFARTITVEGSTCTGSLGIGGADTAFDASINLNATAGTVTAELEATDTYGAGHYFSAADTIDLTLANAAATAKVEIAVQYYMVQTDDNI